MDDIKEKVAALLAQSRRVEDVAVLIKKLMDEQGSEPEWWTEGEIKGVDVRLPVSAGDVDVAIRALAETIVRAGQSPVQVQHGLRQDVWSLNVKLS